MLREDMCCYGPAAAFATVAPGYAVSPGFSGISVPVTSVTLDSINYDTADAVYKVLDPLVAYEQIPTNNTDQIAHPSYEVDLAYTDTETFSWSGAATISAQIASATKVSIPGIGDQTETVTLSKSATITGGKSDAQSTSTTFKASGSIDLPPFSTFKVTVTAQQQDASIPYSWTGTACYKSGYCAAIEGSGIYEGVDTGIFTVTYDCISEPGGCPTGPGAAVPEPPTFVTVPLAFAALLALAAVRRRRRRGSLRDNGFRVLRLA
jgi:hypothetical protein